MRHLPHGHRCSLEPGHAEEQQQLRHALRSFSPSRPGLQPPSWPTHTPTRPGSSKHLLGVAKAAPGVESVAQAAPSSGGPRAHPTQPPLKAALCVQQLARTLEKRQAKADALKAANEQLARQLRECKAELAAAEAAVIARDLVLAARQDEVGAKG